MWVCHLVAERNGRSHPIRDVAPNLPDLKFWIRCTIHRLDILQEGSTVRGSMMWRSWKNVWWGSGGSWPLHHRASDCNAHWCSRSSARTCVNGGHFEHKFWTLTIWCILFVLLILVSVNLIDISLNMCYKVLILREVCYFLPERDYVTFESLLSQFRLSSVCLSVTLVHSTQGVEAFGNISSPLCTLAILWPPCKILRRSSQGNTSVGSVKRKRGIRKSYAPHRTLPISLCDR